jgi:hopene-associated glycosyltransferase HpnB
MEWTWPAMAAALIWFGILLLPFRPWGNREVLEGRAQSSEEYLGDITALIPARNEERFITRVLAGLESQGKDISIVRIDDQSTDGTARPARRCLGGNLRIVEGKPLPPGWTGKLWALEQGMNHVHTPRILLLDADIELGPGVLPALRAKMAEEGIQFISLMAALRMVTFWERLFMPAFVYFFKLLYPFHLSNSTSSRVAAAAGGCILLETRLLREMDGFKGLRGELIDDCALARRVKSRGYKTWIGLTHSVKSIRPYAHLSRVWNMVARSAFAQLGYSSAGLLFWTAVMTTAFWLPVAGLFFPAFPAKVISAFSLGAMMLSYLPTLRFYRVPKIFMLAMPLTGTLYLAMSWTSAVRFWQKKGSEWKGRYYKDREI